MKSHPLNCRVLDKDVNSPAALTQLKQILHWLVQATKRDAESIISSVISESAHIQPNKEEMNTYINCYSLLHRVSLTNRQELTHPWHVLYVTWPCSAPVIIPTETLFTVFHTLCCWSESQKGRLVLLLNRKLLCFCLLFLCSWFTFFTSVWQRVKTAANESFAVEITYLDVTF